MQSQSMLSCVVAKSLTDRRCPRILVQGGECEATGFIWRRKKGPPIGRPFIECGIYRFALNRYWVALQNFGKGRGLFSCFHQGCDDFLGIVFSLEGALSAQCSPVSHKAPG